MKAFVVGLMLALLSAAIGYTYYAQTLISDQISAQDETLSHLEGNVRLLSMNQSDLNALFKEAEGASLVAEVTQLKEAMAHKADAESEWVTFATTFAKELAAYSERLQKLEVAMNEHKTTIKETVKAAVKEATAKRASAVPTVPGVPTAHVDKTRVATPSMIKPRPVTELPFEVLTLETRGTEPFLVIAPKGVVALSMARFYRAGDEIDGYWLLKTIVPEQRLAVFVNLDRQVFTHRW